MSQFDSLKGLFGVPFFMFRISAIINNTMEESIEDGRWNWWGLLEEEPEEEENDTNNK